MNAWIGITLGCVLIFCSLFQFIFLVCKGKDGLAAITSMILDTFTVIIVLWLGHKNKKHFTCTAGEYIFIGCVVVGLLGIWGMVMNTWHLVSICKNAKKAKHHMMMERRMPREETHGEPQGGHQGSQQV
ncbi:hypothetical protein EDC01DRAFT_313036 [Geopyxis carbonaria]|nr:hypothetical protein EDC01DRAFT_313036 [Geopyxis carbonaria]